MRRMSEDGVRLLGKALAVIELLPGSWTEKFSANVRGAVLCINEVH
ncbi:hypothetical protein BDB13_5675 [Rhodococcus sp. OK302]|nr:hypothetical protein BDB13_5675 [Rhodococcus sp. OK302]